MCKILPVEDHEELSDFLSRRLQRRETEDFVAQDGEEGLAECRRLLPDVLLLDMNLSEMDVRAVAQALKTNPVIQVCTSSPARHMRSRAIGKSAGCRL